MRIIRSYIPEKIHVGQELVLSELASNHLVRVLRLGVEDICVLFNGDGFDYRAKIVAVAKRGATVEILSRNYRALPAFALAAAR